VIPEPARVGFGAGADAYASARPTYPPAAVEWVVSQFPPSPVVVDLAAGTGIFTALLRPFASTLVAVEPVESMRAKIASADSVLDGTAESLPLDDASVDVVTVAQAFHWFRYDDALREIARVLRPGGLLVLVWNRRDDSVPWVKRMDEVIEWRAHHISNYDQTDWPAVIGGVGLYGPVAHESFPFEHVMDRAVLADRVRSVSYIAAMPSDQREAIAAEVVALADAEGFGPTFPLPYTTLAWTTHRS